MNEFYNPNLTRMNLSLSLCGDDDGVVDLEEKDRVEDQRGELFVSGSLLLFAAAVVYVR